MNFNKINWFLFTAGIGLALLVTSSILLSLIPNIIGSQIAKKLALTNGTDGLKTWIDPETTIYTSYYVFNVANPDQVALGVEKPKLVEKGPYVFRERRIKEELEFNDDETIVSYVENKYYEYDSELSSNKSLDDIITIINIPGTVAVMKYKYLNFGQSFLGRQVLNNFLKQKECNFLLFEKRSIRELLLDGYSIPFAECVNKEADKEKRPEYKVPLITEPVYMLNNSNDGRLHIYTGKDDIKTIQQTIKWKGNETMNVWQPQDSFCNKIKGTDGSGFAPLGSGKRVLSIFAPKACLASKVRYMWKETVKGIVTSRYSPTSETYASPNEEPENECRRLNQTLKYLNGLIDMATCKGAPGVYVSQPHFLDADEELLDSVEGLKPDRNIHESFISVEPITGKSLKGAQRGQIVVRLEKDDIVEQFKSVSEAYLPILWFESKFELSDDKADRLKERILNKIQVVKVIAGLGIVVGILTALIGFGLNAWNKSTQSRRSTN